MENPEKTIAWLLKEKQLTEKLLGISEALVNVSQRDQLFHIIIDKIGQLLPMDDMAIVIMNEDRTKWKDISIERGLNDETGTRKLLAARFDGWQPMDSLTQKMASSTNIWAIEHYKEFKDFPKEFIKIMEEQGLKEFMFTPLRMADEPFGFLVFDSKTTGTYSKKDFPLFQVIADQLAAAVSNVLANEQLVEEKQFKETLLEISEVATQIRDREGLYRTVMQKLKPLVGFEDAVCIIFSEDKKFYNHLLTVASEERVNHPLYNEIVKRPREVLQNDPLLDLINHQKDMNHIHLKDWMVEYPDFPGFILMKETGLKDTVSLRLKRGGEVFGLLFFHFSEIQQVTDAKKELYLGMTDQLSIAISNVLANEQLLEEKQFKETLLEISEVATQIRDREGLYQAVMLKLKPLVKFNDSVLVLFSEGQQYYTHVQVSDHPIAASHPNFNQVMHQSFSLKNSPAEDILNGQKVDVFEVEAWLKKHPDHPGLLMMKDIGEAYTISLLLYKGGVVYATLLFHFIEKPQLSQEVTELYANIADQLAVAVSNVLANEQLIEEKRKTEDLLAITESIANITTGPELVKAIFDKLQKVFPFDEAGLFHLDFENERERDLVVDYNHDITISQEIQNAGISGWLPMTTLSKEVSRETLVLPIEEFYSQYEHPHMEFIKKEPFTHVIAGPLTQGGQPIGLLYFFSKTGSFKNKIPLFKSITDQMSVALSNIIANEDLQRIATQRKLLLDISKDIGSKRRIDLLLSEIVSKLIPMFHSQEHALLLIDKEANEYLDLAVLNSEYAGTSIDQKYAQIGFYTTRKIPYQNSKLQEMVQQFEQRDDSPIYYDYDQNYDGYADRELLEELKKDISKGMMAPLRASGKLLGVFILGYTVGNEFDMSNLQIFQSVSDHLGIAIGNILANEDIQQRELQKGLEVAVVHAINVGKNWEEKLVKVTKILAPDIPFTLISFGSIKRDQSKPHMGFERIGFDEYRTISIEEFLKVNHIEPDIYNKEKLQVVPHEPMILNEEDLPKKPKEDVILKGIRKLFDIRSIMYIPYVTGNDDEMYVVFCSKESRVFTEAHMQLVQKLMASFTLAMEKQLAYQEIAALNSRLQEEKEYLIEEVQTEHNYQNIIGNSPVMLRLFQQIEQIAPHESTVLLQGETGTGKELIARAIHNQSGRAAQLLIKVNCAALPENLIESELFGHEKGAFTGALKQRIGKFELADKGTIFLDEIGELPLALQAKLLRVLQEKEFERLGSNKTQKAEFRVITATNRNLQAEVQAGNFREDLYYRLSVFPLVIPALRERKDDIALLANFFAQRFCKKMGKTFQGFAPDVLTQLLSYSFPGNVRELENLMEQSVILHQGNLIQLARPLIPASPSSIQPVPSLVTPAVIPATSSPSAEDVERNRILAALRQTKGRVAGENGAAKLLGLKPTTLDYRIKRLGLFEEMKMIKAGG